MRKLKKFFDKTSVVMIRIATVLMLIVGLSIIINIIGRAFNNPVAGSMEIIQYGMLATVSFALCRTGFKDKHIYVPVFLNMLPKKAAACVRSFTMLVTATIFGYLVYFFASEIAPVAASGRVTDVFRMPYHYIDIVLAFGMLVATVLFLYQTVYTLMPLFPDADIEDDGDAGKTMEATVE